MYDLLRDNDLVITNNKMKILKYLNDNKLIINIRIMNLEQFKKQYYGYYDEKAIYYMINKYNYKYGIAKMYLDNFLFIPELKKELLDNNLIIETPLFKESIKRIVIDVDLDPYIEKELKKYETINIEHTKNDYIPFVYEFDDIEDEVNFVALKIIELLKTTDINKIKLVNVGKEYENSLLRIFKFYNIPINLITKKSIYATKSVQKFIKQLKESKSIELALGNIKKDDIYNTIIDVCNRYQFRKLDDTIIYCIESELKHVGVVNTQIDNVIDIVDINDIESNGYYFILGFNLENMPKIYKNEDFLSDEQKSKIGILTSTEKNILEKEKIKDKILNYDNIIITYKLKTFKEEYYKSSLIDELNLEVKRVDDNKFNHSHLYNKLTLAKKLDDFIKFNKYDDDLSLLYSNYSNIPYLKYDNQYKKIDKNLFLDYINNELLLSYSSIDNYYRCNFRYYINNVLKLNPYEENFVLFIGNLFHYILSKAFTVNFDFDSEFNNYISDKKFTYKEQYFIKKLKKELIFTIDVINKQNNDTSLNKELYEQKIYVNKDRNIKINFMGVIDKIKYQEINNKNLLAIIDYKTGNPNINLDNLIYGIEMQLPVYLYLVKNSEFNNIEIAGFYLQKIIHNKLAYKPGMDYENEVKKLYRLEGFSASNIEILEKFDKNYSDSSMIKGMKTSSKGFYQYTKVLNNEKMDNIYKIVDDKIEEAIDDILDVNFSVNPKRIGQDNIGCSNCSFKDICYMKDENIINLKEQNYKDFLGGNIDA